MSLGHLFSNSPIVSPSVDNLKKPHPSTRGCKIACKRVLFFDHSQVGYLTYLGSPTSM